MIKMDKLTKEVIHRGRSPLDSTNFIVTPVPTHRPEYDPHNPNKKEDPTLSKRVTPFTETTYFIMTSSDSGVNSLVDWTSLKTIKYFSMRDRLLKVEDEGINYRVRSICFFGGSPRANLYLFVGSDIIKSLFMFSAINRNILSYRSLKKHSLNAQISWVNHTNYVYILQTGVRGEPSYISESYFYDLSPNTLADSSIPDTDRITGGQRYLNPTMLAFNMNITSNEVYDEIFDRLDYFYLFLSSSENSIHFYIPPFNWNRCKTTYRDSMEYKMYYGRYRNCGRGDCIVGYEDRKNFDFEKNQTAIQCQKMQTCEEGMVMQIGEKWYTDKTDDQFPKFNLNESKIHWIGEDNKTEFTKIGKSSESGQMTTLFTVSKSTS